MLKLHVSGRKYASLNDRCGRHKHKLVASLTNLEKQAKLYLWVNAYIVIYKNRGFFGRGPTSVFIERNTIYLTELLGLLEYKFNKSWQSD